MALDARLRRLGRKGNLEPSILDRLLARVRRPLDRAYERRAGALNSLAELSAAVGPTPHQSSAQRVLVASLRGWSSHNAYELVIAHALRLRGAQVALLTCGGGMPACELGSARQAHPRPCDRCAWFTDRLAAGAELERFALRDFLPWGADARRAPQKPARPTGKRRDPYAVSAVSTGWLLQATRLDVVPGAASIVDDFAVAADGVAEAAELVLDQFRPDIVFLLNGLFAAERAFRGIALDRGLRAPTYEIAPRADALVFSQHAPAPDYDMDGLWATVEDRPLSGAQREDVARLLADRARGVGAHESYFDAPEEQLDVLRERLALTPGKRVVTLFTNVTWDSATIGHDVGFSSMFDWVERAVALAAHHSDLVLLVRIHPAEGRWGTREEVQATITAAIGEIPANVRFVPALEPVSSYALLDLSDTVLTYTTTVGLEAAARGKRVGVAGDTHYRGRGFTVDLAGPDDLSEFLASDPDPITDAQTELALRYAHAFFFRAMIPFPVVSVEGGQVKRVPLVPSLIAPGADPYLEWVCARILDGESFALPDSLVDLRHVLSV
jgi:Capsule polysaccharide biosynthesis protein